MDKVKKNDIIDVDFTEADEDLLENKDINKKPLYYNCMQVAQIVDEPDSTIRYWSKVFQPLLQIKTSNNVRKYTKTNIENLLFIKKLLKEDGLTVKQAMEYCSKKGFDNETGLIDTSNPLVIQTFISAMTTQMDKKIEHMQNQIIEKQQQMINNLNNMLIEREENLKENIIVTVDEVISEKMNEFNNTLDNKFESIQKEIAITKDMNEKIDSMRESMKQRKEESEKENQEKKSFWSRLLNK